MKRFLQIIAIVFGTTMAAQTPVALAQPVTSAVDTKESTTLDPQNTLHLYLKDGKVVIQLRPDLAPTHVDRIKQLTKQGFYDGVVFHRVIDGFMAQTGDPTGTGRGGSGVKLDAEFSDEKHMRGTVSMARASDPNSADSQFFICLENAPHLDGQYTIFGQVVEGMEFVDSIKRGNPESGAVENPDKIIKMVIAATDTELSPSSESNAPQPTAGAATDAAEGNTENKSAVPTP